MENKSNLVKSLIIILAVVALGILAYYYSGRNTAPTEQKIVEEQAIKEANPFTPAENPLQEVQANPFDTIKTNPFE